MRLSLLVVLLLASIGCESEPPACDGSTAPASASEREAVATQLAEIGTLQAVTVNWNPDYEPQVPSTTMGLSVDVSDELLSHGDDSCSTLSASATVSFSADGQSLPAGIPATLWFNDPERPHLSDGDDPGQFSLPFPLSDFDPSPVGRLPSAVTALVSFDEAGNVRALDVLDRESETLELVGTNADNFK